MPCALPSLEERIETASEITKRDAHGGGHGGERRADAAEEATRASRAEREEGRDGL